MFLDAFVSALFYAQLFINDALGPLPHISQVRMTNWPPTDHQDNGDDPPEDRDGIGQC